MHFLNAPALSIPDTSRHLQVKISYFLSKSTILDHENTTYNVCTKEYVCSLEDVLSL